jgi:predicted heme/steroid binding protein
MLFNTTIIFYMVKFGRLLCPNFDKAWTCDQIAQHTGSNNYYAAVRGIVYDVSSLAHGDHSDVPGLARASIAMSCEFSLFSFSVGSLTMFWTVFGSASTGQETVTRVAR